MLSPSSELQLLYRAILGRARFRVTMLWVFSVELDSSSELGLLFLNRLGRRRFRITLSFLFSVFSISPSDSWIWFLNLRSRRLRVNLLLVGCDVPVPSSHSLCRYKPSYWGELSELEGVGVSGCGLLDSSWVTTSVSPSRLSASPYRVRYANCVSVVYSDYKFAARLRVIYGGKKGISSYVYKVSLIRRKRLGRFTGKSRTCISAFCCSLRVKESWSGRQADQNHDSHSGISINYRHEVWNPLSQLSHKSICSASSSPLHISHLISSRYSYISVSSVLRSVSVTWVMRNCPLRLAVTLLKRILQTGHLLQ